MHPARRLVDWMPEIDFALFDHGFLKHGRDYYWNIQNCMGADPGEHQIIFTHCVQADCQTRVIDSILAKSWDDVFTDYARWEAAGKPNGYVWGTNWSCAYPGLTLVEGSELAKSWSERIGKPFHEVTLETDRYFIRLIFHDLYHHKLFEETGTISAVIIPLPHSGEEGFLNEDDAEGRG